MTLYFSWTELLLSLWPLPFVLLPPLWRISGREEGEVVSECGQHSKQVLLISGLVKLFAQKLYGQGNGCFMFALQIKEPWRQRRTFSVELLTFEIVSLLPYQASLLQVSWMFYEGMEALLTRVVAAVSNLPHCWQDQRTDLPPDKIGWIR